MNAGRMAVVASGAVVVVALAAALWIMGGPETQRQLRLDAERVTALGMLSRALERYRREHRAWPSSMNDLVDGITLARLPVDPATGEPFAFRPIDDGRYELCATFARRSRYELPGDFWFHEAGERCFSFAAFRSDARSAVELDGPGDAPSPRR